MFGRGDEQQDAASMPEPAATAPTNDLTMPEDVVPTTAPAVSNVTSTAASMATAPAASAPSAPSDDRLTGDDLSADDLLNIKQEALQHLQPLVGHLEQSPAEEFRTLMMMIQASDDQSMLKKAFAAAQKITDDKVRAQALLDVINEINYFTQHKQ